MPGPLIPTEIRNWKVWRDCYILRPSGTAPPPSRCCWWSSPGRWPSRWAGEPGWSPTVPSPWGAPAVGISWHPELCSQSGRGRGGCCSELTWTCWQYQDSGEEENFMVLTPVSQGNTLSVWIPLLRTIWSMLAISLASWLLLLSLLITSLDSPLLPDNYEQSIKVLSGSTVHSPQSLWTNRGTFI